MKTQGMGLKKTHEKNETGNGLLASWKPLLAVGFVILVGAVTVSDVLFQVVDGVLHK